MTRKTTVSIDGNRFCINGTPTYPGRRYGGHTVEGLLLNSRMVQGVFDDLNAETRGMWDYPDGPWDPDRNTDEFLAAMPVWRDAGLLSFTLCLQGGSPQGYSKDQPWENPGFAPDGSLRDDYMKRLERILDRADELGMAPMLSYFYFGQDHRLTDDNAVTRATENITAWLLEKGHAHVLIEIANEIDNAKYTRDIIKPHRCHELITLVQELSAGKVASPAGRYLVSASFCGGVIPCESVVQCSDFVLLHGNGVPQTRRIREMVGEVRAMGVYRGQPIVFNEDDHFDFDKDDNNMLAAIGEYAGWGYFDYRMQGEGFDEGYQSVPVNWGISSARKRGFFELVRAMTGGAA